MIHQPHAVLEEGIYHRPLDSAGARSVATFYPQGYEPRYAYPLLVFLHGRGEDETQWTRALPAISRRNYMAVSLRGVEALERPEGGVGYGWGGAHRCDSLLEDYVLAAIQSTMRASHIHSERIFLAGTCEGASVAYQLGLAFPEKFAGIIALNGYLPGGPLPPASHRIRRRLGVFLGHGGRNAVVAPEKARAAYKLLYAAGLDVNGRFYPSGHNIHPAMLRDLDRWVMDRCEIPGF